MNDTILFISSSQTQLIILYNIYRVIFKHTLSFNNYFIQILIIEIFKYPQKPHFQILEFFCIT